MILLSILAFLVIFTALILVHEWGHFTAARTFGVRVEEFGLGLPPLARKLWHDKKGTEYTLNWLPLGGFVRMKGEDTHDHKLLQAKDSFAAKKVWQRVIIVCAGVAMNFVTGFVLLVLVALLGTTYLTPVAEIAALQKTHPAATLVSQKMMGVLVQDFAADAPAKKSELKKMDFITAVNGEPIDTAGELQKIVPPNAGRTVRLTVTRRNYTFETVAPVGADGLLGVRTSEPLVAATLQYSPLGAVVQAGRETVRLSVAIGGAVGGLFAKLTAGDGLPEDIGGPVAIAKETFYRASSFGALLSFAAMLSLTLAVFNILPIPALDGGRLLFLVYEGVTRHRPSPAIETKIHLVGYVLLLAFIAFVSWHDLFGV